MPLTDTHAHLHFDQYEGELDQVLERAASQGVSRILTLGTEYESSLKSLEIAEKYEPVFAAAGIHPTDILRPGAGSAELIRSLAAGHHRIVAIGEIGLDLHWKDVPLDRQLPVFEEMLATARELKLPVVIHNRDAHQEMRHFFEKMNIKDLRGVMHSFSGTAEDAVFYLNRGLYISFTGVITFRNFRSAEVVLRVPKERLLLETDSPFLTPEPFRGRRNEPAHVIYIAERLAEMHGVSLEELLEITFNNAERLFRWNG